MRTMAISEFKAKCLAVLEEVRETGEPILVTRRGQPMAEVKPPQGDGKEFRLGWAVGTARILGDLVEPVFDIDQIEASRP